MTIVNAYCDGSISNALMTDPFRSYLSREYVARLMVLVPDCDLGLIEQTRSGILTPRGTPNSVIVELLAICKAIEFCTNHEIGEFIIYSDCKSAAEEMNDTRIRWASRKDMYLPNTYFDRVLGRATYLRRSEGKKRRPTEPHQLEIFELFQAERREFRLSQSPLWARICKDEKKRQHRTQP